MKYIYRMFIKASRLYKAKDAHINNETIPAAVCRRIQKVIHRDNYCRSVSINFRSAICMKFHNCFVKATMLLPKEEKALYEMWRYQILI